jgi:hypothetical protein
MTGITSDNEYRSPRTLIFSHRNIHGNAAFRCPHYEFEDIICQIDSAEILAPKPIKRFALGTRIANRVAEASLMALNPGIPKITLKKDYDLLFAVFAFPKDLLNFNVVQNWKERCKTTICLIDEFWVKQFPQKKFFLNMLKKFDYVLLYYSQSVKPLSLLIGEKCFFVPPAVDAILFCPYPESSTRSVDVYSVGRKSEITHQKLLDMVKERNLFYIHDSIAGTQTINAKEHRLLLANVIKRSRCYIVNPGLVDRVDVRGSQSEIGNRYFEGAASGAVMIGEIPINEEFGKLFSWPDPVIQLPYGSDKIGSIIRELDNEPEREEKMHRNNVINALRRHDWVYRWETVLKIAGLNTMLELMERKQQLENLANIAEKETRF